MTLPPQLWDAGPVRILTHSHKRGAPPVVATCREPGCTNPRRTVQGARYCEDHARGKDYAMANCGPSTIKTCVRNGCAQEFPEPKKIQSDVTRAWTEFCPDCRSLSPLTLQQLQSHRVPPHLVTAWLKCGEDLPCAICNRTLTRRSRSSQPVIDHDHSHCPTHASCGRCIRGVVCTKCNTEVGHLEGLVRAGLFDQAVRYIKGK
jgi:Recombination endonuclease VII